MKYVTSVKENNNIKHIVEANDQNIEVIQLSEPEDYGNLKGEQIFSVNGIKVSKDFRFRIANSSYDYAHLAQVVLAIELVRFVSNHINPTNNT